MLKWNLEWIQFFHKSQHWYSVSIDTQKPETQTLEGVSNLKFLHMIDIYEIVAIFQFFHNGWHLYSVDTQRTGDTNFPLVQFSKFLVGSVFPITHPRFCFNINAWLCLKHLCIVAFLHSQNWRCNFSIDLVFWIFGWFSFPHHPS